MAAPVDSALPGPIANLVNATLGSTASNVNFSVSFPDVGVVALQVAGVIRPDINEAVALEF